MREGDNGGRGIKSSYVDVLHLRCFMKFLFFYFVIYL